MILDWKLNAPSSPSNKTPCYKTIRLYLIAAGIFFAMTLFLKYPYHNRLYPPTLDFTGSYIPVHYFPFLWMSYFLLLAFICWYSKVSLHSFWVAIHACASIVLLASLSYQLDTITLLQSACDLSPDLVTLYLNYYQSVYLLLALNFLLQTAWFIHWRKRLRPLI